MTTRFLRLAEPALEGLRAAAHVLDLLIRLYVANVFLKAGLVKIGNWDGTRYLFENEYRVPLLSAEVAAHLGTFAELLFPPLLAVGLLARFAALSLFALNVVAVIAFWHVLATNEPALMSHFYWGLLLAVTLLHGPGALSLDHWLWKRMRAASSRRAAGSAA